MATASTQREAPTDRLEAAEIMRSAGAAGMRMRPVGGATKLGWGRPAAEPDVEIATGGLARMIEYNEGDFTAIVEPGMPLARAQQEFEPTARCWRSIHRSETVTPPRSAA